MLTIIPGSFAIVSHGKLIKPHDTIVRQQGIKYMTKKGHAFGEMLIIPIVFEGEP